ncbi:DUF6636 domain-containing protein [Primorskyibacter sp. 2E107]|uniref:DUF6636 domain-containing protein n=1 Tax=Primorskyibacter sp. 2E107 TaxID=3403458 RepID=UPI003AF7E5CD
MKSFAFLISILFALPAWADGFGFRTPSGNIYCNGSLYGGAIVDCVIVTREPGSAPAQAGNCPAGRELEVSLDENGGSSSRCGRPSGRKSTYSDIANYGVTAKFGNITCVSESTGFQCVNPSGHGFFLSRRKQNIW